MNIHYTILWGESCLRILFLCKSNKKSRNFISRWQDYSHKHRMHSVVTVNVVVDAQMIYNAQSNSNYFFLFNFKFFNRIPFIIHLTFLHLQTSRGNVHLAENIEMSNILTVFKNMCMIIDKSKKKQKWYLREYGHWTWMHTHVHRRV